MEEAVSLSSYLQLWAEGDIRRDAIAQTVECIAKACSHISALISRAPLAGHLDAVHQTNTHGGARRELDLLASELVIKNLRNAPVAVVVSEELDLPLELKPDASLCIAIDPLDGSSDIDTNISVGTLFSVLPYQGGDDGEDWHHVLQAGFHQLAAGYAIYGPHTSLVLSVGEGTQIFTLSPESREFLLTTLLVQIPKETRELAINVSNFHHWDSPVRAYIDDCLEGLAGDEKSNYNMRWGDSLVAECHRILNSGGICLYPSDARCRHQNGRLRLLFEANPIGWIIEQAEGLASTGRVRVLDVQPNDIHQRAPFVFGSRSEVKRLESYYRERPPLGDRPPLFNQRGLFRA